VDISTKLLYGVQCFGLSETIIETSSESKVLLCIFVAMGCRIRNNRAYQQLACIIGSVERSDLSRVFVHTLVSDRILLCNLSFAWDQLTS
jgi:hypothetical protein